MNSRFCAETPIRAKTSRDTSAVRNITSDSVNTNNEVERRERSTESAISNGSSDKQLI